MDSAIDGSVSVCITNCIFLDDAVHLRTCFNFVMFAMGLTLTAQVFLDVFKQPMKVILVSVIQFLWMPLGQVSW